MTKLVMKLAMAAALFLPFSAQSEVSQGVISTDLPSFDFRGHKIGDAMVTFNNNGSHCRKNEDRFRWECPDKSIEVKDAYGFSDKKIGEVPVINLNYYFINDQFYELSILFYHRNFPEMSGMLEGKYGPPSRVEISTMQSGSGASYDSLKQIWSFKEGELIFYERYARVDASYITFTNPELAAEVSKKAKEALAEAGKAAF